MNYSDTLIPAARKCIHKLASQLTGATAALECYCQLDDSRRSDPNLNIVRDLVNEAHGELASLHAIIHEMIRTETPTDL